MLKFAFLRPICLLSNFPHVTSLNKAQFLNSPLNSFVRSQIRRASLIPHIHSENDVKQQVEVYIKNNRPDELFNFITAEAKKKENNNIFSPDIVHTVIQTYCLADKSISSMFELYKLLSAHITEQKVFHFLLQCFGKRNKLVEMNRCFSDMPEHLVDVETYNIILEYYARYDQSKTASTFRNMLNKRIKPNKTTFINWLHGTRYQFHDTDMIFKYIKSQNGLIDESLCEAVIDSFFRTNQHQLARKRFDEMKLMGFGSVDLHNQMIRGYGRLAMTEELAKFFDEMERNRVGPDQNTIFALIEAKKTLIARQNPTRAPFRG
eukprot:TRINITY_DN14994_c0_g1_i1.p1 TRINITY_DN14994_c0_g1~~TRINITY_DN14994_c0_g1_i1.p1  ORF type:complete len:320 (+),score=39.08 TRINITY_DN14994_c0_g1_i1:56-1015(+)